MIQLVFFVVASAGIIVLSWPPLRLRRSHGFYRFFTFEAIAGLVALNLRDWFREPFAAQQIIS